MGLFGYAARALTAVVMDAITQPTPASQVQPGDEIRTESGFTMTVDRVEPCYGGGWRLSGRSQNGTRQQKTAHGRNGTVDVVPRQGYTSLDSEAGDRQFREAARAHINSKTQHNKNDWSW